MRSFIPSGSRFMHQPTSYCYSPTRTRKHPSYLLLKHQHNLIKVYLMLLRARAHTHTHKKKRSPLVFCYHLYLGTIQTQGTPASFSNLYKWLPFPLAIPHLLQDQTLISLISLIANSNNKKKKTSSYRSESVQSAPLKGDPLS
jgi:hypothetical protein